MLRNSLGYNSPSYCIALKGLYLCRHISQSTTVCRPKDLSRLLLTSSKVKRKFEFPRPFVLNFHSCFFWLTGFKEKYRLSEDDRKRCKATLERLRYELNTDEVVAGDCDCNVVSQAVRDLDLAQGSYNTH